jgi:hypothetical protein
MLIVITVEEVVQPVGDVMRKLIKVAPNRVLQNLGDIAEHGKSEGVQDQDTSLIPVISQVAGSGVYRYSLTYRTSQ